jgi:hypothetical protein
VEAARFPPLQQSIQAEPTAFSQFKESKWGMTDEFSVATNIPTFLLLNDQVELCIKRLSNPITFAQKLQALTMINSIAPLDGSMI